MILAWIGHSAFGSQFSQQDSERPDVRFNGEAAVQSSLGCRPLDGKFGSYKRTRFISKLKLDHRLEQKHIGCMNHTVSWSPTQVGHK